MDGELYHYGVMGQKWGIRRYQNPDGTLTSEGRKHYRQEVRADNKKAYEYGKEATILGRAVKYSVNRAARMENKAKKLLVDDPTAEKKRTKRAVDKEMASKEAAARTLIAYKDSQRKAQEHCRELMKKYGKENVKDISYKDVKVSKAASAADKLGKNKLNVVNERTHTLSEWAVAGASWVGAAAIMATGVSPIAFAYIPYTTNDYGRITAATAYDQALKSRRS